MGKKRANPGFDRELSWLAFNGRVLQEAEDPSVPLGERLNFLAIFSSNLDEFFRVRVASLRSLLRLKKKRVEDLGFDPAALLREIHTVVTEQQERFGRIFRHDLLPALERRGISLVTDRELSATQREFVRGWFAEHLEHVIESAILEDASAVPWMRNRAICLAVELWPREGRGVAAIAPRYALVNVPSPPFPRFLALDGEAGSHAVIFIDDVIRLNLDRVFPAFETGNAYAVKMSRDAELPLEDEFAGDLVESIRKGLERRETGPPCRFLFDLQAPLSLIALLAERLDLEEEDLVPGGRYHNLADLAAFPQFGAGGMSYRPLEPSDHPGLEGAASLIEAIDRSDHLLHFPYQRFDYVLRLLEEAARDPEVEEIWITLYRVARDSAVAEALIHAAGNGKKVTAFVEVKARFDEESNLAWAERMERAGVRTLYSMPGLKVHAKLALIVRRTAAGSRLTAWLGTGNFNERTARVYTDLALLTSDERITRDVRSVFAFLAGETSEPRFEHLLVAPFNLRKRLYRLIEAEAEAMSQGDAAGIILKMNSLEDARIIDRLYRAASAGVDIQLIIRGICRLVPGVPGVSESIHARSIVDRYLEHARAWVFENRGTPLTYLASADWMTRNLSRRIEVAFPILDPSLQVDVRALLAIQLADNQKARIIDDTQSNTYIGSDGASPVRAQHMTWRLLRARVIPDPTLTVTSSAPGVTA